MALKFASAWTMRDAEFDRAFASFAQGMESRRTLEHQAAITIQVAWRKHAMRQWRKFLDQQATTIQRVIRSHQSRHHTLRLLHARASADLAAYHHAMATRIQAAWRGHHSRTHVFDYYARQRYLQQLAHKSDHVRAQLDAYERAQRRAWAVAQHARVKRKQAGVARKVHHLLGTHSVPGVLAPAERRPPEPRVKHPALHVHRPLSPTVRAKLPPRWVTPEDAQGEEEVDRETTRPFGHLSPPRGSSSPKSLAESKMYLASHSDLMLHQPYAVAKPTLALGQREMRLLALAEHVLANERQGVQRAYAEDVVRRATCPEVRRRFAPDTRLGRLGKLAPLVGGEKALTVDRALTEQDAEAVMPLAWRASAREGGRVGVKREANAVGM